MSLGSDWAKFIIKTWSIRYLITRRSFSPSPSKKHGLESWCSLLISLPLHWFRSLLIMKSSCRVEEVAPFIIFTICSVAICEDIQLSTHSKTIFAWPTTVVKWRLDIIIEYKAVCWLAVGDSPPILNHFYNEHEPDVGRISTVRWNGGSANRWKECIFTELTMAHITPSCTVS